jgi:glycosyltransferase involved in cell wall biosynthesis
MYDISSVSSAPKVRITRMIQALGEATHVEVVTGGRLARFARAVKWLLSGGRGRVGAVYVESATTSAMPTDILFLALMRLLRRPVGVYFRDAYQLYRDLYPRRRRRQILSDWLWRITTPLLALIANRSFAATAGLARAMGLKNATPLGPGTDPDMPDLGAGAHQTVAYVGAYEREDGFELLLSAMEIVHRDCPAARLLMIGPVLRPEKSALVPDYATVTQSGRSGLADLLRDARVCVIPRPVNAYSSLAQPVKLWDYLSMGKPVVATAATETAQVLAESGAGIVTADTPLGLAEGLLDVLTDEAKARHLAARARVFACSSGSTWAARARTVVETLGVAPR